MTKITEEVQKLETGNMVILYELDLNPIGVASVFRFTQSNKSNGASIVFNGLTYSALDFDADGFEWDGKGTFPTPSIRISNVANLLTAVVIQYKDLLGAKLTRIKTFAQFLDGGADPDTTATFPPEIYNIDQKTSHNKVFIEFKLASIIDQTGRKLPGRIILRDVCGFRYRTYSTVTADFSYANVTCPYVGSNYFTENDRPTNLKSNDKCSKHLSGCKLRFGKGEIPFGGFPGAGRDRVY